jgi:2-keto-4-pentenoate hydratase/2-oxohepta-3-ene-1,7-dioic acid hydratase in catechol pathway
MKIVAFTAKNGSVDSGYRLGALMADGQNILDFSIIDEVRELLDKSPLSLYDLDGPVLKNAAALLEKSTSSGVKRLNDVKLVAPVPRPGKVICIGLNYRDHAAESNMPIPSNPILFSKFATSIVGHDETVTLPVRSEKVDYEAELVAVIGRKARNVPVEKAYDYVLGYTCFNDLSARDFQFADVQWQRGKSADGFGPMGQYIATKDEIPDPQNLSIKLRLNGETMQNSTTGQMIFGVPELVSFISETITLEPGDVIATGTPPGVGFARKPPVFLKKGDVTEVEIQGLGILTTKYA